MEWVRFWLEKQIHETNPSKFFLLISMPLSLVYHFIIALRNLWFDRNKNRLLRLPGKVISIGNIGVGGSGKTPLTIACAKHLLQKGLKPAILSRGYGGDFAQHPGVLLLNGKILFPPSLEGIRLPDEGLMTSQELPHVPMILGKNRYLAAQECLKHLPQELKPSHWILDDGFQHRKIVRDLDLVLLDAKAPFGNQRLLPSGNLREPPSALRRAHQIILTRAYPEMDDEFLQRKLDPYFRGKISKAFFHTAIKDFSAEKHNPSFVVCGIANPQRFLTTLNGIGVQISESWCLSDHQKISRTILQKKVHSCCSVITTAKDYWRDPEVFVNLPVPVLIAQVCVDFDWNLVDSKIFE